MAYNSSNYYEVDPGVYHQTSYGGSYDIVPSQVSTPYPSYEYNSYDIVPSQALTTYASYESNDYNYKLFDYDPAPYYGAYDSAPSQSIVAYSASSFSEPKYIEYEPQFTISYSVAEFNVPEFDDYDPTPYGGGYDIAQTYGKPLPHSEEICYPRSSMDSNAPPLNGFSYGSIPSPYGKEEVVESAAKPRNGSKPTRANEEERQILGGNGHASHNGKPLDSDKGKESKENYGDDYNIGAGYGSGVIEDHGYAGNGSYGDHSQIPSGYGLEAMDLCEIIFGYWPCLCRKGKGGNDCQQAANEESYSNQWKGTADYLFGSSYQYGERRDVRGNYGNAIYGYERHHQQQSHHYGQTEYGEDSWVHKFNIF